MMCLPCTCTLNYVNRSPIEVFGCSISRSIPYIDSHCDTEEISWKVMLVFLLHSGQSSSCKHLLKSQPTNRYYIHMCSACIRIRIKCMHICTWAETKILISYRGKNSLSQLLEIALCAEYNHCNIKGATKQRTCKLHCLF